MNFFHLRQGLAEEVPLAVIARKVGTPTYVYSQATLNHHLQQVAKQFQRIPHLLCYAVKANSNLAILKLIAGAGFGFDIVSGGELARVVAAGGDPKDVVFSGVGKREDELRLALRLRIAMVNVESAEELVLLDRVAQRMRRKAPFALRVNPEVDARTHPHIATGLATSKFGIAVDEAAALYRASRRMQGLRAVGVDCHIGSQLTDMRPLRAAVGKVAGLFRTLRAEGFPLTHLDVGGGLGVPYRGERPPSVAAYAKAVCEPLRGLDAILVIEPGRLLVANAGILLTQVLFRKRSPAKHFVVVDAGMNDLLRPALYDAAHEIVPLVRRRGNGHSVDVVGPVCESSDVLGTQRRLGIVQGGDLLAITGAGAYGMSMASNYNSRPRPAEVLVNGSRFRVIRKRESIQDLYRGEVP